MIFDLMFLKAMATTASVQALAIRPFGEEHCTLTGVKHVDVQAALIVLPA